MADRALRFDILGRDKTLGRTLGQSERKFRGLGTTALKVGTLIGGAFAGIAITAGIKSTIDAASDLNESISKSRVVFGKSGKAVELFARTAAKNLGQSRQQALEATATFGNLFVSMKLGQKPAADMSIKIVRLASDLASFNNVKPEEALEALRSGLVGETEPLRRFGINLNDADLRQRALALGLTKTTKSVLPPAIKAQAAYSLIMEQSKTAQGDFARTAGGAANQQRIFAARVKDLQANIGRGLLPVFSAAIKFINERLVPAVSGFATSVREQIGPAISALTSGVKRRLGSFNLALTLFKIDLKNLADRAKGWALVIIGGFKQGLQSGDWSGLGEIVGNALRQAIGNGTDLMKRAFGGVDWFNVGKAIGAKAAPFAFGFVFTMLDGVVESFKKHPIETLLAVIIVGKWGKVIGQAVGKIPIAGKFLKLLVDAGERLFGPIVRFGEKLIAMLGKGVAAGLASVFPRTAKRLEGLINGSLLGTIRARFAAMVKAGAELIHSLGVGIGQRLGFVGITIGRVISAVTRPFRGIGGWLIGEGRELVSGLRNGIASAIGSVGGVLRRLKDAIVGGLKRLFGIGSPSKVMAGIGANLVAGLVRGLVTNRGSLQTIVKSIGGDVIDWLGSIFGGIGAGPNIATGGIQKLAQRMAAGYGWTGGQWAALRTLVQNESGWNPNAANPTSTAYGLFQFLDSTWASVGATKTASPVGQISAGLRYIKSRYGSPAAALGAWQSRSPHWYGSGGIFRKPTIIGVGEKGPEAVIPLDRAAAGITVHLDLRGSTFLGDASKIVNEIAPKMRAGIRDVQRRSGVPPKKQLA